MGKLRILFYFAALAAVFFAIWWAQPPAYIETFPSPKAGPFPAPLLPEGRLAIEGVVQDPQGAGIPDSWVTVLGIKTIFSARCDREGRFRVEGLAPGSFEVTAGARGFRPASASISSGAGPVRLGLQPLGHFGDGPNPPPPSSERFTFNCRLERQGGTTAGFAVALIPQDIRISSGMLRAEVAPSGIFQIEGIEPGAYTLRVLSAARAQDLDFCFALLPVSFGPKESPPDLVRFTTRSIEGAVLVPPVPDVLPQIPDPSPYERAAVKLSLLLPNGDSALAGLADTDEQGLFSFRNLPEGDYELSVLASDFERIRQRVDRSEGPAVSLRLVLARKRP